MRTLIKSLIVTASLFSCVYSAPAGLAVAVDIDVVKNVKDYVMPIAITEINKIVIPDLSFEGGHISGVSFQISPISPDSIATEFNGADNSIVIRSDSLAGTFRASYFFGWEIFCIDGDFEVTIHPGSNVLLLNMPLGS